MGTNYRYWIFVTPIIESDAHTRVHHTVPYGTAPLGWRCTRHFLPGYDRTVPLGHFATGSSYVRRDGFGSRQRHELDNDNDNEDDNDNELRDDAG
jgi:hypothetical protein